MPAPVDERLKAVEDEFEKLKEKLETLRKENEALDRSHFRVNAIAVAGAFAILIAVGVEFYQLPKTAAEHAKKSAEDATDVRLKEVVPDRVAKEVEAVLREKVSVQVEAANTKVRAMTAHVETNTAELDKITKAAIDKSVRFELESARRLALIDEKLKAFKWSIDPDGILTIDEAKVGVLTTNKANIQSVDVKDCVISHMFRVGIGTGVTILRRGEDDTVAMTAGFGGYGGKDVDSPYNGAKGNFTIFRQGGREFSNPQLESLERRVEKLEKK